jgi:serine/threonine protein kinase
MATATYPTYIGRFVTPTRQYDLNSDVRESLQGSLGSAYTIERELGGGGMSRTFVATESALSRRVVVKVLAPELAAGVSVERFRREIMLAAKLQHPHVVPVLSSGEADGLPWFTMPFVEGESLRLRLARGPMGIGEATSSSAQSRRQWITGRWRAPVGWTWRARRLSVLQ